MKINYPISDQCYNFLNILAKNTKKLYSKPNKNMYNFYHDLDFEINANVVAKNRQELQEIMSIT